MADDMDIEAMLEAPYKKEDDGSSSRKDGHSSRERRKRSKSREKERHKKRSRSRSRERKERERKDRDKDRDREREKEHSQRREKDRDRNREREHRDKEKEREKRYKEKERERERESRRSPPREHLRIKEKEKPAIEKDFFRRGRPGERFSIRRGSISPLRVTEPEMTPEERDARTVFCMQLAARIRPRDLEEFFSSVGKVRDIKIITDNKTRRSKGIAYVEFDDTDSVPLAIGLGGQRLLGVPIIVQASQAEKNRLANATPALQKGTTGPMRLYVGSLHFNITEEMLKGIFEPFGKIDDIKLMRNHETGRSQGYGFITFHGADDAKRALEQLNGFELAGRPMKVGHVTERTGEAMGGGVLDSDEMDRAGVDLGATGRLQLMAKLAEGTGFQLPAAATNALQMAPTSNVIGQQQQQSTPPIATQCFMLSNMFEPGVETTMRWDTEIRDDVIEECNKHGGVLHIYVDKASPQGNVYVKCPSIAAAVASVQSLHGRWFAGKVITAAYVPLPSYHQLFPDAQRAHQLMMPSTQALNQVSQLGISSVQQVFL